MKLLIKVLLLVLAVSTFAATGVTRKRSHAKILTKKSFAQQPSWCSKFCKEIEIEKSHLDKVCTFLHERKKDLNEIKRLCTSVTMIRRPIDLCTSMQDSNASYYCMKEWELEGGQYREFCENAVEKKVAKNFKIFPKDCNIIKQEIVDGISTECKCIKRRRNKY